MHHVIGGSRRASQDLPDAAIDAPPTLTPEAIMQLGLGFWGSKTLLSAVELGLFTELAKGPLDAETLRAAARAASAQRARLPRRAGRLGMLERDEARLRATRPRPTCSWTARSPRTSAACSRWRTRRLYRFWGVLTEGAAHRPAAERGQDAAADFFGASTATRERLRQFLAR